MIGLGSNRLSVCRRGGMRVTQAGRGGMEWLAGGRSVSPYSAQATAALKAQFPTQWPTIRDYGFAHPALVPFINEDPMLVCSLMELGKIRYLVGDGASYCNSDIVPQNGLTVESIVSGTETASGNYYGVVHNFNGGGMFFILYPTNAYMTTFNAGSISFPRITQKTIVQQTFAGSLIIDGVNKGSKSGTPSSSHAMCVMGAFDLKSDVLRCINISDGGMLAEWKPKLNGVELCKWVPFVSTTRDGMLDIHDLEHPVFHPNQGTGAFTTIEQPNLLTPPKPIEAHQ